LQLCCIVFNFYDQDLDIRGKECKRETLVELAEYVNTPVGQKIFTEAAMPDIIEMVRVNLFRTLPPPTEDLDIEDEEGNIEPAWPHLQIIYELFLRFIISPEVNGKAAKKFVDAAFLRSWIELFDAEDPRERDYVKTILHRKAPLAFSVHGDLFMLVGMYGKFMSYRSNIRRTISQVFYRYIYETGRHNGIAELLEILGSIINGFAIPLKREHLLFLENALIPLHKPAGIAVYHPQLSYCISQYVEKDPETVVVIVQGLIRFWPCTHNYCTS
jgi:serine/threonine-protein phosphatase 2A regulatory subunit B'